MVNIKNKAQKILILIVIIQFIFAFKNVSHAAIWDDLLGFGDKFIQDGQAEASDGKIETQQKDELGKTSTMVIGLPSTSQLTQVVDDIYNILFPLAVGITVVVAGVLGIKFMMETVEGKAKIKESMKPYLMGCAAIYGAFGIWKLAITIFSAIG